MYKSPIDIIYGQLETQMEGEIIRAVQRYDIDVDKDELVRALRYDRDQYKKGYSDAKASMSWIPVSERLPEVGQTVLCYKKGKIKVDVYLGAKYTGEVYAFRDVDMYRAFGATHWAPLPQPPEGVCEDE